MTIERLLENPLWSTGVVQTSRSELRLLLNTIPGVVGGEFHAELSGIKAGLSGTADVSLTCTSWDMCTSRTRQPSSPNTHFYEIERVEIKHSKLDIRFLIPFEAKGTEEDATWELVVELPDGTSEMFEVPICRTDESDPEITSIKVSSLGSGDEAFEENQQQGSSKSSQYQARPHRNTFKQENSKPYQLRLDENTLHLRIPGHVLGRPSFAKGGLIVTLIWVGFAGFVAWLIDEGIGPWLIAGIPGTLLASFTVFARFGVTEVELNQIELAVRYRLFGLGWTKRIPIVDIDGFKSCCVGKLPTKGGEQISYAMMVRDNASRSSFIGAGLLDKPESRTLSTKLNGFLESIR